MDPTTAIPIHFTLHALGIAAGGLLLAWSLVRRQWAGVIGAAMLTVGEGLHSGRYVGGDDDPALLVLRFAGIALFSVAALRLVLSRGLYVAGAGLVFAGTAWGAVAGGGIADPTVGPHVLLAVGFVVLSMWSWLASRDSVRLRVLTALVAMLALAVVVGGGAVSRVAALDKQNEQLRQLGSAAQAVGADLARSAADLQRRAALLSPLVADELGSPGEAGQVRAGLQTAEPEAAIVIDPQRDVRAVAWSGPGDPGFDAGEIAAGAVFAAALGGRADLGFQVADGGLVVLGTAPVFRPGATQNPEDVIGAVGIAQDRSPLELREMIRAYAPGAEVVLLGRTAAASERSLLGIQPRADRAEGIDFERVDAGDGRRPAATSSLGDVRLVVVGSDAETVDAAAGLLRALLVAILAAALLAVIVALWLSARVTRPILDVVAGAEQVKADFLASLSHELRTPLTPIRGYTEILRRGRVPTRRAADYLDEIGVAAGRLERIVTLLLDVAAQEAGRFRIDPGDPRPAALLSAAAERWEHENRRHPIRVVAARSLPRVHADPEAMARVLDELIDNAVKFSPEGGEVELRARRSKEGVEISVSDEGIGLSADEAAQLTRAFSQVESGDRRRYGGLGLGLAYVSGVLAEHGASLSVGSKDGSGAAFSFVLPAAGMVSRMPARSGRKAARQPEARS